LVGTEIGLEALDVTAIFLVGIVGGELGGISDGVA
jgi:hypothetical protein